MYGMFAKLPEDPSTPEAARASLKNIFAVTVACVATGIAGYNLGKNEAPAVPSSQTQQDCTIKNGNN